MKKLNYIISNQNKIKFMCLNDNIEHSEPCAVAAKNEIINQFYEVLFTKPSKFEKENFTELTVPDQSCTMTLMQNTRLLRDALIFTMIVLMSLKVKRKFCGKTSVISMFRQKIVSDTYKSQHY